MYKNTNEILKYFKKSDLGCLDQPKPDLERKRYTKDVVRKACFINMIDITKYDQKYGITFTFAPKFHNDNPLFLHRLIDQKIASSRLWKKCKYILYPEFNSSGVLHYHGFIYDCYQSHMAKLNNWWKRTYGTITKIEYDIRYPYCGQTTVCIQKNKSNAKYCWIHYVSKDVGKTGLWTIYSLKK